MLVLGSHKDSWIPVLRAAIFRLSQQIAANALAAPTLANGQYKLSLLDGQAFEMSIHPKYVHFSLIDSDGSTLVHVRDETIALDEEDLEAVVIDNGFITRVVDRWLEIAADYQNIDPSSSKTAQMAALSSEDRQRVIAIYQHFAATLQKPDDVGPIDIHLTLPTEYWTGNVAGADQNNRVFTIANDPAITEMLEHLPTACEIIAREGEGVRMDIVPLYMTPVRIG